MTTFDDDGQPRTGFNNWRNLQKSMDTLLGICAGLIADNRINKEEALFLDTWLRENEELTNIWPGEIIAHRVSSILQDGLVTEDELSDLKDILKHFVGTSLNEQGIASGMASSLPIDQNVNICINKKTFCLTGKFLFGPRAVCCRAITDRNGLVSSSICSTLDYLVIGTLSSRDWIHTSYGRKIEMAVRSREKNGSPLILAESDWTHAIAMTPL